MAAASSANSLISPVLPIYIYSTMNNQPLIVDNPIAGRLAPAHPE